MVSDTETLEKLVTVNTQVMPTVEELTKYCAENAERFSLINDWLTTAFYTEQKVVEQIRLGNRTL